MNDFVMNRQQEVETQLHELANDLPGFLTTDIVSIDGGLSIAGWSSHAPIEPSMVSAIAANIAAATRSAYQLVGRKTGSNDDIVVTTGEFYLLIRMLGDDYVHAVALSSDKGNLALARVTMGRMQSKLQAFVENPA